MKLTDYQKSSQGGQTRVSMKVCWEDSDREPKEIFIETPERFGSDLQCSPNAFLLAAAMPAMAHREKRILAEGPVDPDLRDGLRTVMLIYRKWYGGERYAPIAIEATGGFHPLALPPVSRAASFMSGGVDALTTMLTNHEDFPSGHPHRIRDCIFVHGFDLGGYAELEDNRANSDTAVESLRRLEQSNAVELISVRTNIRHIDDDDSLFFEAWYGSALAALAHAFSPRINRCLIASGSSVDDLGPIGSHPLTDQYFSSTGMTVVHDGIRFSRLEKVGIISQYPDALQTLRACFDAFRPGEALNCGRCEKCLRTMTALVIHGKLGECPTYPGDDVTPAMIETIHGCPVNIDGWERRELLKAVYLFLNCANVYYWREMIPPLQERGRKDLVDVIRRKVSEFERSNAPSAAGLIKRKIKEFDHLFLGSNLARARKLVTG